MKTDRIDDGGPAFPDDSQHNYTGGMTLRDYFAAAAMAAIPHCGDGSNIDSDDFARACYQFADSMLAARKEKP